MFLASNICRTWPSSVTCIHRNCSLSRCHKQKLYWTADWSSSAIQNRSDLPLSRIRLSTNRAPPKLSAWFETRSWLPAAVPIGPFPQSPSLLPQFDHWSHHLDHNRGMKAQDVWSWTVRWGPWRPPGLFSISSSSSGQGNCASRSWTLLWLRSWRNPCPTLELVASTCLRHSSALRLLTIWSGMTEAASCRKSEASDLLWMDHRPAAIVESFHGTFQDGRIASGL